LVTDRLRAHIKVLYYPQNNPGDIFNLETGDSDSALEIAEAVKNTTGKDFEAVVSDGGAGGPTELVAIPERKRSEPSWRTECKLDDIVRHVRAWHLNLNS
jgi:UDP-glucose 4-epimerase